MEIAQFKKMLAAYGADLSRWEGADPEAARAFLEKSPQARDLYRQAQALDSALAAFTAPEPDPAFFERVMGRLDPSAARLPEGRGVVVPFFARKAPASLARPAFWSGGAALAACAVLLAFFINPASSPLQPAPSAVRTAFHETGAAPDVEPVLAELETLSEEDVAHREMLGLLEMAAAQRRREASGEDIDAFLDEILSAPDGETNSREDMDLWQMFLESQDVREL